MVAAVVGVASRKKVDGTIDGPGIVLIRCTDNPGKGGATSAIKGGDGIVLEGDHGRSIVVIRGTGGQGMVPFNSSDGVRGIDGLTDDLSKSVSLSNGDIDDHLSCSVVCVPRYDSSDRLDSSDSIGDLT